MTSVDVFLAENESRNMLRRFEENQIKVVFKNMMSSLWLAKQIIILACWPPQAQRGRIWLFVTDLGSGT